MCLAIAATAGRLVPESHLRAGWAGNSHGAGFAFIGDKGKVEISKGHMKIDDLLAAYKDSFDVYKESPFLIHFRTATHGPMTPDNTHPFPGKYGALVHNGIFNSLGSRDRSDTAEFADLIADVPEKQLPTMLEKFEKLEGGWSKLAFLGHSGKLYFMREDRGIWDNGIWYSNYGYRTGAGDFGGMRRGN